MYHHLKTAEQELKSSGKQGTEVKSIRKPRKIGFTVSYAGNIDKLISRIVYNVRRYGIFIPERFNYTIGKGDFVFKDAHNGVVWSVTIEKTRRVRYFNFQAQIKCLP